jgi:hypothetical protein
MKTAFISAMIGILLQSLHTWGFSLGRPSSTQSQFMGRTMTLVPNSSSYRRHETKNRKGSQMNMFLGTDSGILGVGAPEIVSLII